MDQIILELSGVANPIFDFSRQQRFVWDAASKNTKSLIC